MSWNSFANNMPGILANVCFLLTWLVSKCHDLLLTSRNVHWSSGRPGTAQTWGPRDLWHALAQKVLARPSTENKRSTKIKILKIQIRSAQNVGKVWISRKKSSWPHLGPSEAIFSMDRKNTKNAQNVAYFPWWAMGPIHPVWGHVLVSCCNISEATDIWAGLFNRSFKDQ